ncbi:MAG: energy-coupling factor transporter ATPase [Olsenella sp.]
MGPSHSKERQAPRQAGARPDRKGGAEPLLSLRGVVLRYDNGVRALDGVDLDVLPSERLCVLGANGSGKSTLGSVLCGLLAPDEGEVTLLGERVLAGGRLDFAAYRRARRGIGLVFQNPDDQIVTTVVEEDVAFGPENLGLPPEEIGRRVRREIRRVALDDYAKADPTLLSGGQKQRLAIAGALAMEPRAIVFDEPAALLDVRGRRSILEVMDELRASGIGMVHITHYMDEALTADRVVVLDHGRVRLEGTPGEVFAHADEFRGLGLEEPFPARLSGRLAELGVGVGWTCDAEELAASVAVACADATAAGEKDAGEKDAGEKDARPATAPAGAAAAGPDAAAAPAAREGAGEPAVLVDRVSYGYADGAAGAPAGSALDGVSLEALRGESVAIVGQTGSGKSTLLRLVCALDVPDSGTIRVDGLDTADRRSRRLVHGRIGYVMQFPERQLFAETVARDVAYGPTNLGLPPEEVARRVDEALALVGLSEKAADSPFELSGGQQRLCALAGVLAMRPETIVLDEPSAGLDPRGRIELESILADVHARGATVIRVTHSMEEAAEAERVVVLDQSRVLMQGTPAEVFSPENGRALREAGLGLPRPLRWALRLGELGVDGLGRPLTTEALARAVARRAGASPAGAAAGAATGAAATPKGGEA